jgi:hypothetical protein
MISALTRKAKNQANTCKTILKQPDLPYNKRFVLTGKRGLLKFCLGRLAAQTQGRYRVENQDSNLIKRHNQYSTTNVSIYIYIGM